MGRDGLAFVAIMLFVAFLANQFLLILGAILSVVGIFAALALFFAWLKGGKSNPTVQKWTSPLEMNECSIPRAFNALEELVLREMRQPNDTVNTLMTRYVAMINAHTDPTPIPTYLHNGVAMKMLWEYRKKNGSLAFPSTQSQLIGKADVLRPLDPQEVNKFHEFCALSSL